MTPFHAAGANARQLCQLAFDLNSAALALAAEAAELACHGIPVAEHDLVLSEMGRALTDLVCDLEGGAKALRRARLAAAWTMPSASHAAAYPAE